MFYLLLAAGTCETLTGTGKNRLPKDCTEWPVNTVQANAWLQNSEKKYYPIVQLALCTTLKQVSGYLFQQLCPMFQNLEVFTPFQILRLRIFNDERGRRGVKDAQFKNIRHSCATQPKPYGLLSFSLIVTW